MTEMWYWMIRGLNLTLSCFEDGINVFLGVMMFPSHLDYYLAVLTRRKPFSKKTGGGGEAGVREATGARCGGGVF